MIGGSFEYSYHRLNILADEIEQMFVNDGKTREYDEEYDYLNDATEQERELILTEVRSLIVDLKILANRAKELEWYTSGDTGSTTYLERLSKIKDGNNRR